MAHVEQPAVRAAPVELAELAELPAELPAEQPAVRVVPAAPPVPTSALGRSSARKASRRCTTAWH